MLTGDSKENETDPTLIRRRDKGSACAQKCAEKKEVASLDSCDSNLILDTRCCIISTEYGRMDSYRNGIRYLPSYWHFDRTT